MKNMLGVRNPHRDHSTGRNLFEAGTPGCWRGSAIYQGNTITQFNKQGDFELLDRDTYRPRQARHPGHGHPDPGDERGSIASIAPPDLHNTLLRPALWRILFT